MSPKLVHFGKNDTKSVILMRVAKFDQERYPEIQALEAENERLRKLVEEANNEKKKQLRQWRKELKQMNKVHAKSILEGIGNRDLEIVNKLYHTEVTKQIGAKTIKVIIQVLKE